MNEQELSVTPEGHKIIVQRVLMKIGEYKRFLERDVDLSHPEVQKTRKEIRFRLSTLTQLFEDREVTREPIREIKYEIKMWRAELEKKK